ncbi:hypothetical protein CEE87_13380, partial [Lactobacillus crispatus]
LEPVRHEQTREGVIVVLPGEGGDGRAVRDDELERHILGGPREVPHRRGFHHGRIDVPAGDHLAGDVLVAPGLVEHGDDVQRLGEPEMRGLRVLLNVLIRHQLRAQAALDRREIRRLRRRAGHGEGEAE